MNLNELTHAIYVASTNTVVDLVKPDGRTCYGNKTLEEVKAEPGHADAVLLTWEEASERHAAGFRSPVKEIDRARYWESLEVLPPCKWRGIGSNFETFHVSERIAGNIVSWFIRLGHDTEGATPPARYFALDDDCTLTVAQLEERVRAFISK